MRRMGPCGSRLGLVIAALIAMCCALVATSSSENPFGFPASTTTIYSYDTAVSPLAGANVTATYTSVRASARSWGDSSRPPLKFVAAETAGDAASVGFRSNATHVFRDAAGHFADDTAANRAIIRGAVDPANLRSTITLKDGATLSKYFQTLPDGTQAWAEVRNGTEITNGGLNVTPR